MLERYKNIKANDTHEDVIACLSDMEKHLLETLVIIKTPGKGDEMVPVLLTKQMQGSLKVMCSVRDQLPQFKRNIFLFAAENSDGFIDATSSFRELAKQADLEKPEHVRAINLRRHVGTMAQILNLGPDGLKILSKFMSHSDADHKTFYELPENTLLLTKASKVQFAMERGIHKFKGQTLDEIEIETDEEVEEENEEDPQVINNDSQHQENEDELQASNHNSQDQESNSNQEEVQSDQEEALERAVPSRKRAKKTQNKNPWSKGELNHVNNFFRLELLSLQWPKMDKCIEFINKYNIKGRTWRNVKDQARLNPPFYFSHRGIQGKGWQANYTRRVSSTRSRTAI